RRLVEASVAQRHLQRSFRCLLSLLQTRGYFRRQPRCFLSLGHNKAAASPHQGSLALEEQNAVLAYHCPVLAVVVSQAVVASRVGSAGGPWPHGAVLRLGQEDYLDVAQRTTVLGDGSFHGRQFPCRPTLAARRRGC